MAGALKRLLIGLFLLAFAVSLPLAAKPVAAAEMDKHAKADAKTAMRFYKQGNYEDAAKVFLKLSVAYPDMLVFVRNIGACYYYLRRYEPALSNLRDYEHRKKNMDPDDRAEVEGWIGEMERLRDQAAAATPTPAAPAAVWGAPLVVPAEPPSIASETAVVPAEPPAPGPVTPEPAPGPARDSPAVVPSPLPAAQEPAPVPIAPENLYFQQQAVQPAYGHEKKSGGTRKAAAWILGIAGVGSAGVGAYLAAKAASDFSKVEKKYDPNVEKEGKNARAAAWILCGAGVAALTVAIIVGASGDSGPPALALAPVVGPGAAGASLRGRF